MIGTVPPLSNRPNYLLDAIERLNLEIQSELTVTPERPSPDQLLTTAALAGLLMVSPRTVEAWRHSGTGPRVTRIGSAVRYRYADVVSWLAMENRDAG